MGLTLYNNMVVLYILKITWFGEAFQMCLALSYPKDFWFWCHRHAGETAAKTYWILKEGGSSQARSHQLAVRCFWWIVRRYGKETLVGEKCSRMMIFADGAGDMGNLQNRKTNIDSRYF